MQSRHSNHLTTHGLFFSSRFEGRELGGLLVELQGKDQENRTERAGLESESKSPASDAACGSRDVYWKPSVIVLPEIAHLP